MVSQYSDVVIIGGSMAGGCSTTIKTKTPRAIGHRVRTQKVI